MGVMVLGAVAAFASHSSKTATLASETGYVTTDLLHPCNEPVQCSTIDTGSFCTASVNGIEMRAYGKWDINDVSCDKTLYRLN